MDAFCAIGTKRATAKAAAFETCPRTYYRPNKPNKPGVSPLYKKNVAGAPCHVLSMRGYSAFSSAGASSASSAAGSAASLATVAANSARSSALMVFIAAAMLSSRTLATVAVALCCNSRLMSLPCSTVTPPYSIRVSNTSFAFSPVMAIAPTPARKISRKPFSNSVAMMTPPFQQGRL